MNENDAKRTIGFIDNNFKSYRKCVIPFRLRKTWSNFVWIHCPSSDKIGHAKKTCSIQCRKEENAFLFIFFIGIHMKISFRMLLLREIWKATQILPHGHKMRAFLVGKCKPFEHVQLSIHPFVICFSSRVYIFGNSDGCACLVMMCYYYTHKHNYNISSLILLASVHV